jgi:hypothetical protein
MAALSGCLPSRPWHQAPERAALRAVETLCPWPSRSQVRNHTASTYINTELDSLESCLKRAQRLKEPSAHASAQQPRALIATGGVAAASFGERLGDIRSSTGDAAIGTGATRE